MKTKISSGDVIDLVAPAGGVTSGRAVKIGAHIVIPVTTAAEGELFSGHRRGEFDHIAEGAASNQVWAVGDVVYWDDTAKQFTKTTTGGNTKAGIATAAKVTTGTTGRLVLVPTI